MCKKITKVGQDPTRGKNMLSKVYSAGVFGIDGFEVTVECSGWDRL